jgi:heterodisulfide reductase subunit A
LNDALQLEVDDTGFIAVSDYYRQTESKTPGIFLAGTASGPRDLPGTIANAAQAAANVAKLLKGD